MPFALSGYKWGTPTYGEASGPVYWSSSVSAANGLDYNTTSYNDGNFDTEIQQAFQAWENISGVDFEQATAANPAVLTVGMGSLPGDTVGQAFISFQPLPTVDQIISVAITMDSDEFWSPEGDVGTLDFYAVLLHEIGHGIGLDHVNDITEIMNPFVAGDTLGTGDIEGAQEIYGDASGGGGGGGGLTPGGGTLSDDGGSGGGAAFLGLGIIGIVAALIGVFTGGGATAGLLVLAGKKAPEDDEDETTGEIRTDLHQLFATAAAAEAAHHHPDDGHAHHADTPCSHSAVPVAEMACGLCGTPGCESCGEDQAGGSDNLMNLIPATDVPCASCGTPGCVSCDETQQTAHAEAGSLADLIPIADMSDIPCDSCGAPGCVSCDDDEEMGDLLLI